MFEVLRTEIDLSFYLMHMKKYTYKNKVMFESLQALGKLEINWMHRHWYHKQENIFSIILFVI